MTTTDTQKEFPLNLLEDSIQNRIDYFKKRVINHTILEKAHKKLLHYTYHPGEKQLIIVVGCTGVGKTTLLRRWESQIISDYLQSEPSNLGRIPIAGVELAATEGVFDWTLFYRDYLKALHDPFIYTSVNLTASNKPEDPLYPAKYKREMKLREKLEIAILQRNPVALWGDEAQHLSKTGSGRKLLDHMDAMKSLSNRTGCLIVLFGTFDTINLLGLSAQLDRRTKVIPLHRFRYDPKKKLNEIPQFKKLLYTFQKILPLDVEPNLTQDYKWFYENSIGCPGILKDWLLDAYTLALESHSNLTKELLTETKPKIESLRIRLQESIDGETRLEEYEDPKKEKSLRILLNLEKAKPTSQSSKEKSNNKSGRKPGNRNPKRDAVGYPNDEE